jgi:hypothetical protein
METFGKILVGIGAVTIMVGLFLWLFGDKLTWFGNLPGDIKVEGDNVRFYAPITSMIIISIVLSVILSVIARFFR